MPNFFAYFMLCFWPLIGVWLYKRFDTITATFWTIVGGYLFLPVKTEIDFPMIPAFDKESIPAITAFICIFLVKKKYITLLPKQKIAKCFVILISLTPFFTVVNNSEEVFNGLYMIQGMSLYDSISVIMRQYILLLPFIIATQIVKSENDLLKLTKLFVISGLIYSLIILWEVKMSPQLHTDIYGFFPHSFIQQVRYDGYRPMGFLGHGLVVGIYMMVCFALTCALWKKNERVIKSVPTSFIMFYLLFILLICKATAAFLLGVVILLLVFLNQIKLQKFIIISSLTLILLYPTMCLLNIFPHNELIDFFMSFDPARAQSLDFRFFHESLLIEHAQIKFWHGWGSWGRNRLAESVTDSYWIIVFGQYGAIGFYSIFGLACYSILASIHKNKSNFVSAIIITMCFLMIDQLVNSSVSTWVWLLFGSVLFSPVLQKR